MGRTVILVGLGLVVLGLLMSSGLPIGRLPGDFSFRRGNASFYFPLTTSILASVVLTLLLWLLNKR